LPVLEKHTACLTAPKEEKEEETKEEEATDSEATEEKDS